ncbi:hypothetical protein WA026_002628 [Henosepilachna vigintioctopunctata]|uniref:Uncharacterized protein n=1 Tax=Henosepilachna vigintioctopunctata TaxID=420089 RepID=A0AAW1U081_9CUCU
MKYLFLPIFLVILHPCISMDCSRSECLNLADPLIREARFIFPDNMEDIHLGCRTWDEFVNCLKHYTEQCFNEEDRRKFNNAVESPIENIHALCMNSKYQSEYLQFAPCIKSTITEKSHCGLRYQMLVDQVSQRDNTISKSTLCCSHDKFKQCVQRETRRQCDRGVQNGPASRFSSQILEKALRFIEDECVNYIPNSGDCHSYQDSLASTDILSVSTVTSEIYPWSTIQNTNIIKEARNPSYRGTTSNMSPTYSWSPSSNTPTDEYPSPSSSTSMPEILGSRTRPASYGRASSWPETQSALPSRVPDNSFHFSEKMSTLSPTHTPYWATTSSWNKMKKDLPELGAANINKSPNTHQISRLQPANYQPTAEPTHWYPAAGSHLSNDVEEPNQQGLTSLRNDANLMTCSFHSIFLLILVKIFM